MKKETEKLLENFLKDGNKIKKIKTSKKKISTKLKRDIKKRNFEKKQFFEKRVKNKAIELNENIPNSEIWFRQLYEKHYKHFQDKYNIPFKKRYIPDVINYKYKYIIEIDGSIHDDAQQKERDKQKDFFYNKHHFEVIRIKAYNIFSYIQAIETIAKIRKTKLSQSFIDFKALTSYNENISDP